MGEIEDAVRVELDQLKVEDIAPGLAAAALNLARHQDETDAPTAAATVARDLRALLLDLRRLAPVAAEGDAVHDIARQREKRRAAAREQQSG